MQCIFFCLFTYKQTNLNLFPAIIQLASRQLNIDMQIIILCQLAVNSLNVYWNTAIIRKCPIYAILSSL